MSLSFAGQLRARGVDPARLFRAFDLTTADGRAKERQRRVALTALASALAKVISVSTALVSVPLTLRYLGAERYGMWMTMSSLVAMLGFADLGVGNGLLALVASANGRDDRARIRACAASAYCVLSLVAVAVIATFGLAYPWLDWVRIFNVQTETARMEAGPASAALVCCFALTIPLNVVQKVQSGLQRGFAASLWQCLSSLIGLIGVLVVIHWRGPLPCLVLAFAGAPLLAAALNSVTFFRYSAPDVAPAWRAVSLPTIRSIMGVGILYFVLQVVAAAAYTSDAVIIAQKLGAPAVAVYSVPAQMFGLIGALIAMALMPLWPAYSEAIARGDRTWALRSLKRSLGVSVGVSSILSALLVIMGTQVIALWVGRAVAPPPAQLLVGLGVWKVVEAGGNALAIFMNGANVVKFQVVTALASALAGVVLKIILVGEIGIAGVVWATVASYSGFVLLPFYLLRRRILGDRQDSVVGALKVG